MRCLLRAAVLAAILFPAGTALAQYRAALVSEPAAQRHGLTRAWFSQIQIDRGRGRVESMLLYKDALYVQTDQATIHALNAETGATLWSKQMGRAGHPTMPPGAGDDLLAVVNGSRLYVANRHNGDILFETEIKGVPGAAPALSRRYVYVPLLSGLILAFRTEPIVDPLAELGKAGTPAKEMSDEQQAAAQRERRENIRLQQEYVPPLACQGAGCVAGRPLVTTENNDGEYVAWTTDGGYLYVGHVDQHSTALLVKYRVKTGGPIFAPPTYLPPNPKAMAGSGMIFAASKDGAVYATDERTGAAVWRFATGNPISQPPVQAGGHVFLVAQLGGMYCLEAMTGKQQWFVPGLKQFLALSPGHVYAVDGLDRIVVLDAKTGGRRDSFSAAEMPIRLTNADNDRLYLATATGLVQCLHETGQAEPAVHRATVAGPQQAGAAKPAAKQAPAAKPQDAPVLEDTPFAPAGKASAPKAAGPEAPPADDEAPAAGGGEMGDDPFALP